MPKAIFNAGVDKLKADKAVLPPYDRLQGMILSANSRLRIRQARLVESVTFPKDMRAELKSLLEEANSKGGDRRYLVTALKRHSPSVRRQEVKVRLANHEKLSQLYERLDPLVGALGWDPKSVRVYVQRGPSNRTPREHKNWCYAERKSEGTKLKVRMAAFETHFETAKATFALPH